MAENDCLGESLAFFLSLEIWGKWEGVMFDSLFIALHTKGVDASACETVFSIVLLFLCIASSSLRVFHVKDSLVRVDCKIQLGHDTATWNMHVAPAFYLPTTCCTSACCDEYQVSIFELCKMHQIQRHLREDSLTLDLHVRS